MNRGMNVFVRIRCASLVRAAPRVTLAGRGWSRRSSLDGITGAPPPLRRGFRTGDARPATPDTTASLSAQGWARHSPYPDEAGSPEPPGAGDTLTWKTPPDVVSFHGV